MTDDELSELEEFLDRCCHDAAADGWSVEPGVTVDPVLRRCCVLGAAVRSGGPKFYSHDAARELGIADGECIGAGFDEFGWGSWDNGLYAMGARFRARFLAGEYDRERCK